MNRSFLNIAAYRFVALPDASALREQLFREAEQAGLKGSVLLAEEGINFCLAGRPEPVADWLAALRGDPRFSDLAVKKSWSAVQPFKRLKFKLKPEIIRMNQPAIRPAAGRAPAVAASTLARWITQGHCDEGRQLKLLDTRNDFEVDVGAFDGAVDWRLQRFSDFPAALAAHRDSLAGHTVVSYCTGGIRCEKATLVMQQLGLPHTWQLDGGILKYFEDTAGLAAGWHGQCFVFDQRESLTTALATSLTTPLATRLAAPVATRLAARLATPLATLRAPAA